MKPSGLTPILNVSDMADTIAWFEKLGWKKGFEWGEPVGFGSVCCEECEIFLCVDGQGGRGSADTRNTFTDERSDTGVWLSIWLSTVDDVDAVFKLCEQHALDVTHQPEDMPWGVREMHLRHPDGHVFRIGCGID